MRKATGKVVSLVLALALVVTSFSSTFAFAATKTETNDVTVLSDFNGTDVDLVNMSDVDAANLQTYRDSGRDKFNLTDYIEANLRGEGGFALETYDHMLISDVKISSISVSNNTLFRLTKVSDPADFGDFNPGVGDYIVTLRSATASGSATVNVLLTGEAQRGEDEITVRGRASFTLTVHDASTPELWISGNLQKKPAGDEWFL